MSNSLPLVSIVTPSYNQASYLRETIESVLAQDYPRIEYIIMDGGSTDASAEIIREYAPRLAHWKSERDGGQPDAVNRGWQLARGEFVTYLNSDDTLVPGAVRLGVQALADVPEAGLSYGSCAWINPRGEQIGLIEAKPFTLADLLLQNRIAQPGVLVRRAALERVGMLDPSMHYMLDYDLWLRIALHFPVVRVPQVISNFRLHDDSKTAGQYRYFLDDNLRLLDKAFDDPALPKELQHLRARAMHTAYLRAALHCYALGRSTDGHEIMHRYFDTQSEPLAYPEDIIALFADHLVHVAPLCENDSCATSPVHWLDSVLSDLPPNARELCSFRSQILARANLAWGFRAHARGERRAARTYMLRALEYHPANARNRGVWSVLLKSFGHVAPKVAVN